MVFFDGRGKPLRAGPKVALEDFQEDVGQWSEHNFPQTYPPEVDALIKAVGVAEEVGELMRALLKLYQKIRGTPEQWRAEAQKETGDVIITLANIANIVGFSLTGALESRWTEVRQRDFQRDRQGHGLPSDEDQDKDAIIARQRAELDALEHELMALSVDPDYERGVIDGDQGAVRELRKILEIPESVNPYEYLRKQKQHLLDG